MMGLAPYGEPRYASLIREHPVDVKPDGSFRLDMRYFGYATGLRMTSERFHALFGGPPLNCVANGRLLRVLNEKIKLRESFRPLRASMAARASIPLIGTRTRAFIA